MPRGSGSNEIRKEKPGGVMRVTGPDGSSFATCNCGCGDKPEPAACYYHGTVHCSKGGACM
jgi:NAD(P)H-flavin reductase